MTNKEKFLALVSEEDTKTLEENRKRIKNRPFLRESQQIALKALIKLDELVWTKKDLAKKMNISTLQVSKILTGKKNLTLKTIVKLQTILDIPILSTYKKPKKIK